VSCCAAGIETLNHTDPDNPTDENVVAYAAVTLCGNSSKGSAPQWEELCAWREGVLDSKRSAEVLSHVANDPACFQQWLDIAEAERWVEEEAQFAEQSRSASTLTSYASKLSPSSSPVSTSTADRSPEAKSLLVRGVQALRNLFQQPLPVYGGAFVAAALAVLIVPLLRTADELSLQQQLARSTDAYMSLQQQLARSTDAYIMAGNGITGAPPIGRSTRSLAGLFDDLSVNDVEQLHVQTGQRLFLEKLQSAQEAEQPVADAWQDWLAGLPAESVDCTRAIDPSHCEKVAEDFQLLGQWSLMNAAACNTLNNQGVKILQTDFWPEQYAIYETIRSLQTLTASSLFAAQLPAMEPPAPEALCAITNSVLAASR